MILWTRPLSLPNYSPSCRTDMSGGLSAEQHIQESTDTIIEGLTTTLTMDASADCRDSLSGCPVDWPPDMQTTHNLMWKQYMCRCHVIFYFSASYALLIGFVFRWKQTSIGLQIGAYKNNLNVTFVELATVVRSGLWWINNYGVCIVIGVTNNPVRCIIEI